MKKLHEISFTRNWNNKLNCSAFTTFRIHNERRRPGGTVDIVCEKEGIRFTAEIKAVMTTSLSEVDEFISYIDTGYPVDEFKTIIRRMHKNADDCLFDLIILKRVEV